MLTDEQIIDTLIELIKRREDKAYKKKSLVKQLKTKMEDIVLSPTEQTLLLGMLEPIAICPICRGYNKTCLICHGTAAGAELYNKAKMPRAQRIEQ